MVPSTTIHVRQTTRPNRVIGGRTGYILCHGAHMPVSDMFARRITIVVQLKQEQEDLLTRMETGVPDRERLEGLQRPMGMIKFRQQPRLIFVQPP